MTEALFSIIQAANSAVIVEGRVETISEYFSADYVAHLTDGDRVGHKTVRQYVATLRRAFPDIAVETVLLVESGDRIAWQRTLRGTQAGAFAGFPGCGREITWREMVTSRLRDRLIVEEWVVTELAERLLRARKS